MRSFFGPGLSFYIENTSDEAIEMQTGDVFINGKMVDAVFALIDEILPGKRAVKDVALMERSLEGNQIKRVELSFLISSDDWITASDTGVLSLYLR